MSKLKKVGYELRDVAIVQAPVSFTNHRGEVDPYVEICDREVYPIFVSPMASVTDQHNYKVWIENKLTPLVPRSVQKSKKNPNGLTFEQRMELACETFVSISLKEAQTLLLDYLKTIPYSIKKIYICIDMAHGTLSDLYDVCETIKGGYGTRVELMTGNVANPAAYSFYADAGIDWCRLSVGTGCFTPNMHVVIKNGLKKISEIECGDEVLTHTGEYHKVTHVHQFNKKEKLYNVDGIKCTENHLFYVVNKNDRDKINENNVSEYAYWIEAKNLDKNKHLLIKR